MVLNGFFIFPFPSGARAHVLVSLPEVLPSAWALSSTLD